MPENKIFRLEKIPIKRSLKRSAIVKLRSRSGSPIISQMAIGIGIVIANFNEDRDRDRDLNSGDRAHALLNEKLVTSILFTGDW